MEVLNLLNQAIGQAVFSLAVFGIYMIIQKIINGKNQPSFLHIILKRNNTTGLLMIWGLKCIAAMVMGTD